MILVFGSLNVDVLVPVPHLPAAGETVLGGKLGLLPGGKGANQALAARRAGAAVAMAGAVGKDAFADIALSRLRQEGVDLGLIRSTAGATGCAAIMVSRDGENAIAVASGANLQARSGDIPETILGAGTLVLCQMEVPVDENSALLRRASSSGGRTMLNLAPAAPMPRDMLRAIDILVANAGEAASLAAEPRAVAEGLGEAFVVTHGAAGSTAFLRGGGIIETPAYPVEAVDTTGAGDTFTGVLAAGLDGSLGLEAALRRASVSAALACLAHGAQTAMPDRAAIDSALRGWA